MIRYKDYAIQVNDWGGFVLSEIKVYGEASKKCGEEYLDTICYPSTLKGCFTKILNLEFRNVISNEDFTIKEALIELEKINNELIEELNKNIKEEIN
jgi:hypothetical protein